ncbi:hypothetical protein GWK47_010076 [Chionoecetes opilio]|uniref:Uncharacterized protein n=1 Tax=Chionoecetes opilio TaxID=41210 RepID=A0A8J4XWJ0_CHIOP|nr:hypothetical protein GWK47_010076 [Chionoecetes opilio]
MPVKEAAILATHPAVNVQGQELISARCALTRLFCMLVSALKLVPWDIMPVSLRFHSHHVVASALNFPHPELATCDLPTFGWRASAENKFVKSARKNARSVGQGSVCVAIPPFCWKIDIARKTVHQASIRVKMTLVLAVILHARLVMVPGSLPVLHVLTTSFSVGHTVSVCVQEEHMRKKGCVHLAMNLVPIVWGGNTKGNSCICISLDL